MQNLQFSCFIVYEVYCIVLYSRSVYIAVMHFCLNSVDDAQVNKLRGSGSSSVSIPLSTHGRDWCVLTLHD